MQQFQILVPFSHREDTTFVGSPWCRTLLSIFKNSSWLEERYGLESWIMVYGVDSVQSDRYY